MCLLGKFPLIDKKENRNKPDRSLERPRLCLDFIVKLHSFLPSLNLLRPHLGAHPDMAQILIISNLDNEPEASTNPNSLESRRCLSDGGITCAH